MLDYTKLLVRWGLRLLLPCLLLAGYSSDAQSITIKGTVLDSTNTPLPSATIMLTRQSDSVMAAFGITKTDGSFELYPDEKGSYYLRITFIGYGDFQRSLDIGEGDRLKDLGKIVLNPGVKQLEGVTIEDDFVPIRIIEDTVEYHADAFKTKPNAVVEDLLKKLPGVEVDRDGNIKAHGEDVQNVLVDGKEFFGDDPKVATKNIPAEVVDKVQVYDKLSDIAEFTGIDDGQDEKTINLKIKDGKKKGWFGNVSGAYGSDSRYKGKFNLNRFTGNTQFSAIGMANNVSEQGFSINDLIDFNGGMGSLLSGGASVFSDLDASLLSQFSNRQGVFESKSGGLNFNSDLSKKLSLMSSYFVDRTDVDKISNSSSINALNQNSFSSDASSVGEDFNTGHRLKTRWKYKFDKSQDLLARLNFRLADLGGLSSSAESSFQDGTLTNSILRNNDRQRDSYEASGNFTYRKKLAKKGRFLIGEGGLTYRSQELDERLLSNSAFYDAGAVLLDSLNQKRLENQEQFSYNLGFTYIEPLGSNFYLVNKASMLDLRKDRRNDFFNINDGVSDFNETLSGVYEQGYSYVRVGPQLRMIRKKFKANASLDFQHSELNGRIIGQDGRVDKTFDFLMPGAGISVDIDDNEDIELNYSTQLREPSIDQLQPVVNNSNPLNIFLGNPDLDPEYNHTISMSYSKIDPFNFRNFFVYGSFGLISDQIIYSTVTDSLLRRVTLPVNSGTGQNAMANISFSTAIRPLKINANLSANIEHSQSDYLINDLEDVYRRTNSTFDLSFDNRKKKYVDIEIGGRFTWSVNDYRINKELNQSYVNYTLFSSVDAYFGKDWIFNADFERQSFSAEAFGSGQIIDILNLSLSKGFANNKWNVELMVSNLLDQNANVQRSSNYDTIYEEETNTLGRYFLLGVRYKISAFGK